MRDYWLVLRELNTVVDIDDVELKVLSEDELDKGPGFGCTSPEQSNKMFSHKANSVIKKQVTITDTNRAFATVGFPGKAALQEFLCIQALRAKFSLSCKLASTEYEAKYHL